MSKINALLKQKAEIITADNKQLIGYGDCYVWLPINDDTEEEDEYLRFILNGEETIYLSESDISEFKLIS